MTYEKSTENRVMSFIGLLLTSIGIGAVIGSLLGGGHSTGYLFGGLFAAMLGIAMLAGQGSKLLLMKELEKHPTFKASQKFLSTDNKTAIAIDEGTEKLMLIWLEQMKPQNRVIGASKIISAELFEDGQSVTKTGRLSQIGGTIVGGVVLGGVGALIGGLTGSKTTSSKAHKVELRILVDDIAHPIHDVNFLALNVKKTGFLYTQAQSQARTWLGLIDVLIKRTQATSPKQPASVKGTSALFSIADEIKKLSELRQANIITDADFEKQKRALLSAQAP